MLAGEIIHQLKIPRAEVVIEYQKIEKKKGQEDYSQLIPLTTERAISLAPSSYTCFVEQFCPNTVSIINPLTKGKKRMINYSVNLNNHLTNHGVITKKKKIGCLGKLL